MERVVAEGGEEGSHSSRWGVGLCCLSFLNACPWFVLPPAVKNALENLQCFTPTDFFPNGMTFVDTLF